MKLFQKMTQFGVILILAAIVLLSDSCTKPSLIGEEILPPEDAVNIQSTDTISMFTTTVKGDSVRTYSQESSLQLSNYFVGRLDDPIFGNSTAITYAQARLLTASPSFENTTLDSFILSLPYDDDLTKHYGNIGGTQTIIASRLSDVMDATETYYSNRQFNAGAILGQKTFVANYVDSLTVKVPQSDTIVETRIPAQLRIPLSDAIGNEFLSNSDRMGSIEDFLDYFRGIEIKGGATNDALISFNLPLAYMTLFYTQTDSIFNTDGTFDQLEDVPKRFIFAINVSSAKSVYYNNNREIVGNARIDAPVKQYMNNVTDTLIFAQAMEGVLSKIRFPYIKNLAGNIINKAELEIRVASTDNLVEFPLPERMIALERLDGNYVVIQDVAASFGNTGGFDLFNGGSETETIDGIDYQVYRLNISGHLQEMVDGTTDEDAIYLSLYPKSQIANRVILGGANNSTYPIKLNLTYTKLD
jgi:hypothetical protein